MLLRDFNRLFSSSELSLWFGKVRSNKPIYWGQLCKMFGQNLKRRFSGALRRAGVSCYFVWRQLARDGPDSREYGRYHLLLTSRLLLMTALASLSPLSSSDWSTLRLTCLSLVDIGGGSEAGVVFIRCVDTWHIYRFSSPHYHSFLRALSWHNATLLLTLISIVFMSPVPPLEMTLTQSSRY